MRENYTPYHVHTELSLLDSCTNYSEYIELCKKNDISSIGFSEHGNIYKWTSKAMECEKNGIKYLHSCEIYLTESHDNKKRDNYHTILIAKNESGKQELNMLIDVSTREDHMYYKNRISFDEFLNISDNIIKISACLASPLNRLPELNAYYDKLAKHYDYYEIQYHNNIDQIEYNRKLYKMAKRYNKELIAGTDTHSSTKYKAECRTIRQLSKNIVFDNEDSFDLTFKSYDEVVENFKLQNSLPTDVILRAIENTNVMADSCERISIDTEYKYPILSSNDEIALKNRINKMYLDKVNNGVINDEKLYLKDIREEFRVIKKIGMVSFMLFMSEMIEWCENNNIPVCPCRGSVGGSVMAYILDITDVDPIKWKTVFSRFANEDRVEIGDIDVDFSPSQRQMVYNYIIDRFGKENTAYILAIGTVGDKGCIDDIGRALKYPLDKVSSIKKEFEINPDDTRKKYSELFYYFDGIVNTVVSQSMHPAGIVASPITLHDNYGTFWKDGKRILQIDMEDVHEVNLVKYDILGLKNIGIIKDTCEMVGIKYPKSHNIDFEDNNVWEDMVLSPIGIFQFESDYSHKLLSTFKPNKINDLSLINASLRPSGASWRDRFINREENKNPSKIIDELLKDNYNYLVFQEDTIAFLKDICGLSGSEADNIRRAIGRKQKDRLDKAMPVILDGYCSKSDKERCIAEEEAKEFLQIIEDSSNYQFGKNHATGYSMIGYYCAMLRYYYPLEFTTAFLNNSNDESDVVKGEELARLKGIKLENPKFRYSKDIYFFDKETNSIFKGVESIKYLNKQVGEYLYSLRDKQYESFIELLEDIKGVVNSRQLNILIEIDYFSEFGKSQKLMDILELYNTIYTKKQFKKDNLPCDIETMRIYSKTETEKMFRDVDKEGICKHIENEIEDTDLPIQQRIQSWIEHTGSCSLTDTTYPKKNAIAVGIDTKYKTPRVKLYSISTGNIAEVKVPTRAWSENKIDLFDMITMLNITTKPKKRKVDNKWVATEEKEYWLENYIICNNQY